MKKSILLFTSKEVKNPQRILEQITAKELHDCERLEENNVNTQVHGTITELHNRR